ncbi:hypothetical protein PsorP6_018080 [Peronosclerospora sorghi]|uniref:Uncharacterized protein n=1 Tax=Peronosclerospora sorghi TaxID=230839 RepID=A0ACC0WCN0_9STRA|nr:hypothetical protein PsorP6_018080 [Peronosclerospora sorghi]
MERQAVQMAVHDLTEGIGSRNEMHDNLLTFLRCFKELLTSSRASRDRGCAQSHPAVADCCCVRGKNKVEDEILKAFVVLKHPDSPDRPTEQEIMDYMAERVASFKKVREVQFIDAIPRNASGIMLRRRLQEREDRLGNA